MKEQGFSSAGVLIVGALFLFAPAAMAQDVLSPQGEFSRDSVRNIFEQNIRPTEQPKLHYFSTVQQPEYRNAQVERSRQAKQRRARAQGVQEKEGAEFVLNSGTAPTKIEEAEKRAAEISAAEAEAKGEDKNNAFAAAAAEEQDAKTKIISKFGDPSVAQPLSAKYKEAPQQMQAAMEAMQNDEPGLAFEYVNNYMRQQREHDEFIKDWVKLQQIWLMREGEIAPTTEPCAEEDSAECEMFLKMRLQGDESTSVVATSETKNMPKEFAALLAAKEKTSKYDLLGNGPLRLDAKKAQVDEQRERALARRSFSGRLPVDSQGKVVVYYFFNAYNKHAVAFGPEVQNLYDLVRNDPNVKFMAFSLKDDDEGRLDHYRRWTKVDFPMGKGKALAQGLGITVSPTMVFVPESKPERVHIETGIKSHFYLDEILKMMQGK